MLKRYYGPLILVAGCCCFAVSFSLVKASIDQSYSFGILLNINEILEMILIT